MIHGTLQLILLHQNHMLQSLTKAHFLSKPKKKKNLSRQAHLFSYKRIRSIFPLLMIRELGNMQVHRKNEERIEINHVIFQP